MEKRDYLLREIEKIGMLLAMIINRISGNKESYAIRMEKQFEEEKEMLLREAGFDLEFFISLEKAEVEPYISKFEGITGSNIELLADMLKEMGLNTNSDIRNEYLEKAMNLYELCTTLDKSFSIDREFKISEIKNDQNTKNI